jgi:hypothetical protein
MKLPMSKIKKINISDPQPIPCPKCKKIEGYFYSDHMSVHYTTYHLPDGKHECSAYSESSQILNYAKNAFCSNCGTKLPFRLNRSPFEELH